VISSGPVLVDYHVGGRSRHTQTRSRLKIGAYLLSAVLVFGLVVVLLKEFADSVQAIVADVILVVGLIVLGGLAHDESNKLRQSQNGAVTGDDGNGGTKSSPPNS
jgi:hypothetical protein